MPSKLYNDQKLIDRDIYSDTHHAKSFKTKFFRNFKDLSQDEQEFFHNLQAALEYFYNGKKQNCSFDDYIIRFLEKNSQKIVLSNRVINYEEKIHIIKQIKEHIEKKGFISEKDIYHKFGISIKEDSSKHIYLNYRYCDSLTHFNDLSNIEQIFLDQSEVLLSRCRFLYTNNESGKQEFKKDLEKFLNNCSFIIFYSLDKKEKFDKIFRLGSRIIDTGKLVSTEELYGEFNVVGCHSAHQPTVKKLMSFFHVTGNMKFHENFICRLTKFLNEKYDFNHTHLLRISKSLECLMRENKIIMKNRIFNLIMVIVSVVMKFNSTQTKPIYFNPVDIYKILLYNNKDLLNSLNDKEMSDSQRKDLFLYLNNNILSEFEKISVLYDKENK
ncbi:hypothetical protein AB837_00449 [bacterium AB1]|nr:hypothetical protein AB837_00449 [bacterium AB1]